MGQNLSIRPSVSKVSAAVRSNSAAGYIAYFTGKSSLTTVPEASNNRFEKLGKIIRSAIAKPHAASTFRTTGMHIRSGWTQQEYPHLWIRNNTTMSVPSVITPGLFSGRIPLFSTQYSQLLARLTAQPVAGKDATPVPLFSCYANGKYMETLHTQYSKVLEPLRDRFLDTLEEAAPDVHQAFVEWLIIHAGASVNNGLSEAIVRDLHSTQSQMELAAESQKVGLTKDFIDRLKVEHPDQFEFIKKLASVARNDLDLPQYQLRVGDMRKALAPWVGPKMASVLIGDYYQVFDVDETLDNGEPPEQEAWTRSLYNSSFVSFSAPHVHSVGGGGRSSTTPMERATDPVRMAHQEYRDKGCLSLDTMKQITPTALDRLVTMLFHSDEGGAAAFRHLHKDILSGGRLELDDYSVNPIVSATVRRCAFDQAAVENLKEEDVTSLFPSGVRASDILDPKGRIFHVLKARFDLQTAKETQRIYATDVLLADVAEADKPLAEAILKVLVRPFIDGHTSFSFQLNPIRRAKQPLLRLAEDWADSAPEFSAIIQKLASDPTFDTAPRLNVNLSEIRNRPGNSSFRPLYRTTSSGEGVTDREIPSNDRDDQLSQYSDVNSSLSSDGSFVMPITCDIPVVARSSRTGSINNSQQFYEEIVQLVVQGQESLLKPLSEGPVKQLALILAANMSKLLDSFNGDSATAATVLGRAVGLVDLDAVVTLAAIREACYVAYDETYVDFYLDFASVPMRSVDTSRSASPASVSSTQSLTPPVMTETDANDLITDVLTFGTPYEQASFDLAVKMLAGSGSLPKLLEYLHDWVSEDRKAHYSEALRAASNGVGPVLSNSQFEPYSHSPVYVGQEYLARMSDTDNIDADGEIPTSRSSESSSVSAGSKTSRSTHPVPHKTPAEAQQYAVLLQIYGLVKNVDIVELAGQLGSQDGTSLIKNLLKGTYLAQDVFSFNTKDTDAASQVKYFVAELQAIPEGSQEPITKEFLTEYAAAQPSSRRRSSVFDMMSSAVYHAVGAVSSTVEKLTGNHPPAARRGSSRADGYRSVPTDISQTDPERQRSELASDDLDKREAEEAFTRISNPAGVNDRQLDGAALAVRRLEYGADNTLNSGSEKSARSTHRIHEFSDSDSDGETPVGSPGLKTVGYRKPRRLKVDGDHSDSRSASPVGSDDGSSVESDNESRFRLGNQKPAQRRLNRPNAKSAALGGNNGFSGQPLPGGNLGGTFSIVPGVEGSDHSQFLDSLKFDSGPKGRRGPVSVTEKPRF